MDTVDEDVQITAGEKTHSHPLLDAQTRSRPRILTLGIYSAAIISFLLVVGLSILPQPTGHLRSYTRNIMVEGTSFKELAYAVTAGSGKALEMGDVELVMADMRLKIQYSHLRARKAMVPLVRECTADAKNVTRGLQRLTSKIGGVVNSVTAVQALEGIHVHKLPSWPISIFRSGPFRNPSRDAFGYLLRDFERLTSEIELNTGKLRRLDACLTSIQELIACESSSASLAKPSLLQGIWKIRASNRKKLRRYGLNLALLKDLAVHHERASRRVTTALETLREARDGLEGIKERSKTDFGL